MVQQKYTEEFRAITSLPYFFYGYGHCGDAFTQERSLRGYWLYACVCLETEPRPHVACPYCEKVGDFPTVSKHLKYGCEMNGSGGRMTVQWKRERPNCKKLLTQQMVDDHLVRGKERVERKKAMLNKERKGYVGRIVGVFLFWRCGKHVWGRINQH